MFSVHHFFKKSFERIILTMFCLGLKIQLLIFYYIDRATRKERQKDGQTDLHTERYTHTDQISRRTDGRMDRQWHPHPYTNRQTLRLTDRRMDGLIDRQTDEWTHKETDRQMDGYIKRQWDRRIDRWKGRQTDTQTDRWTHKETERQTDGHTKRQTDERVYG
jgi:hypothetical protein